MIQAENFEGLVKAPDSTEQLVVSWLSQEARVAAGETGPRVVAKEVEEEVEEVDINMIEGIIW